MLMYPNIEGRSRWITKGKQKGIQRQVNLFKGTAENKITKFVDRLLVKIHPIFDIIKNGDGLTTVTLCLLFCGRNYFSVLSKVICLPFGSFMVSLVKVIHFFCKVNAEEQHV